MPQTGKMLGHIFFLIACLMVARGDNQHQIAGVSHMTITVSNLTSSVQFYTQLLGGMVAENMSMLEPTASREYVHMMTRGKLVDDNSCDEDDESGNCESLSSSLQVSWAFIVFDNTLLQLVQYTSLTENPPAMQSTQNGDAPNLPPKPHMDMMGTKIAFWVMDTVNMTEYANKLEEESHRLGFNKVRFIRPILLADTADSREANEGVHSLRDETLRGLSIGYATGPDGESLKFIQLLDASKDNFNRHYCRSRMVSSALLDRSYVDRCGDFKNGHSSQLYGINHISITTMDINKTLDFYVNQMGGYLIDDVQPSNLQSPSLQKLLMKFKKSPPHMMASESDPTSSPPADQIQPSYYKTAFKAMQMKNRGKRSEDESVEEQEAADDPSRKQPMMPSIALNLRYVLLGNIKFEIAYLSGLPDGMNAMLSRHPAMMGQLSNSFMTPGNMEIAFAFHTNENLLKFLNTSGVVDENSNSLNLQKIEEGPLAGLEYTVVAGPTNDPIRFVHFTDESKRALHFSLREYGSVNTLFSDTNPWSYNGYQSACAQHLK